MNRSKLIWPLFFLVIVDLILLNYQIIKLSASPPPLPPIPLETPSPTPTPPPEVITPTPSSVSSPTQPVIIQNQKTKSVAYLPIPGSGQSSANTWENLPGTEFYLDSNDYPGLKEAYFEANLKLLNGNGQAFLRLFDTTAGIEVWGSEIKSSGQNFTAVVSGKLTIRPGNHLYRVQAKSLTADTAVFNSGRIKLVSQN